MILPSLLISIGRRRDFMDSYTAEMMAVLLKSVYDKQLISEQTYHLVQHTLLRVSDAGNPSSDSLHTPSMTTTKGAEDRGYSARAKRTHDGEKYL
jgi:hypothetical protein